MLLHPLHGSERSQVRRPCGLGGVVGPVVRQLVHRGQDQQGRGPRSSGSGDRRKNGQLWPASRRHEGAVRGHRRRHRRLGVQLFASGTGSGQRHRRSRTIFQRASSQYGGRRGQDPFRGHGRRRLGGHVARGERDTGGRNARRIGSGEDKHRKKRAPGGLRQAEHGRRCAAHSIGMSASH